MRKKIVAGNWKMNTTPTQAIALLEELKPLVKSDNVDVIICVPFISLMLAAHSVKDTKISIGAQNMFYEDSGAFTGEISPSMIKDSGADFVIIGHSERRKFFYESDEMINKKVLKAFECGLTPIICCGETLEQRELGITIDHIKIQMKYAFKDVSMENAKKAIIAYEPIWAIGTGKVATCIQAEEVCASIRDYIGNIYDIETAESVHILYGGSVSATSAEELFCSPNIDGGLVGGVSLKTEFGEVVNYK